MTTGYNPEADAAIWPRALQTAQNMLMTGPRAQVPSFRAVRKIARRIVNGCKSLDRPWRSYPAIVTGGGC